MSETLHFLPWLRRGLGLSLTNVDDGVSDLPRNAQIGAWIEVDEERAEAELSLRPADHAVAIDTAQIIRRYPAPGAGAEHGYFPILELLAPDLPWLLTPAAPDDLNGRLRPWIVLVCVEEDQAEFVAATDARPARLVVPADELPDLTESYAWAHVQSAVATVDVVGSLTDSPGAVIARMVCPRRLSASTTYRAAVVNAFTVAGDRLVPAWAPGSGSVELIVYDSWTFITGEAGSFEELCRRLGPVDDATLVLGLRATDVTNLGSVDPWPPATRRVTVDYAGALCDADVHPKDLGALADHFAGPVIDLLDQNSARVTMSSSDEDPVVTPPFYGAYATGAESVPARDGWLRQLNIEPRLRASAGLGAAVVRQHQEQFMAMAWRQAGELRETNRQLTFTRLQAEVGRTWKGRVDRLDPHQRVSVLRPQLSFARDDLGQAPRRSLRASTIPNGLVSPSYWRVTRPGGVVATAAAGRHPEGHIWNATLGDSFGSPGVRETLRFAIVTPPDGTRFADPRRPSTVEPGAELPGETLPGEDFPEIDLDDLGILPGITTSASNLSLDALADLATTSTRPMRAARDRIEARIPALVGALADANEDELPSRVAVGPVIDEALVWSLVERSAELLMPGAGEFPDNSVRVVEANPEFIASFLAGANHEMARELLWREYPADMAATTFRRFWDRPNIADVDIDPITDWGFLEPWEELGAAGGESVVLLIRGDLIRHYPTVRVRLRDPSGAEWLASFGGRIPPDVRFWAFDVDEAYVVTAPGSGWNVIIEEQPTEPRFGLDTASPADGPPDLASWNDLCWEHLTGQDPAVHLVIGSNGFPSSEAPPAGATWGLNAAHMARATYQAPFRMIMAVTDLLGGPS